jgi:hypothetical protein
MAFIHPPVIPTIHPHHSQAASDLAINDDLDTETAALIAKLALDDLADILSSRKGKGRADSLPSDEEIAYRLQSQQFNEWLSIAEDAKLAKSIDDALVTDAPYLDALITAEEATAEIGSLLNFYLAAKHFQFLKAVKRDWNIQLL